MLSVYFLLCLVPMDLDVKIKGVILGACFLIVSTNAWIKLLYHLLLYMQCPLVMSFVFLSFISAYWKDKSRLFVATFSRLFNTPCRLFQTRHIEKSLSWFSWTLVIVIYIASFIHRGVRWISLLTKCPTVSYFSFESRALVRVRVVKLQGTRVKAWATKKARKNFSSPHPQSPLFFTINFHYSTFLPTGRCSEERRTTAHTLHIPDTFYCWSWLYFNK